MSLHASVIVPAYNAGLTIQACLKALLHQTVPVSDYEVIVVDDGSTDDTALKAAAIQGVRVIRSTHHGAAAARNRGAQSARGDILLFTDADCEPTADWVHEMLAPFAEPSVQGAKGTYRTRRRELTARFVQCEYEEKYARMAGAKSIDFVDTYSAAYRRDVFLKSGGFDESILAASVEDQEFSFRLAEQGARLVFLPTAIVYHQHPATLAAYARRKFGIGYWKVKVHRRHPAKVWQDSHTPPTEKLQVVLIAAVMAVLCAAAPVPLMGSVAGVLAAIFVASALPLVLFIARRDPAVALVAPVLIVVRAASLAFGLFVGLGAEIRRRAPADAATEIALRTNRR
jgi:cellulose synthase/poly-beta-1,6-N-acetylglucosamine synthase-like glycosyltransferase